MRNLLPPYRTTLVASAARTTTGSSSAIEFPFVDDVVFIVNVTAASGTSPTLDLAFQITPDDTNYFSVQRFAQITGTGARTLQFSTKRTTAQAAAEAAAADTGGALATNLPCSRNIKFKWTIGGTNPSFTFVVYAIAASANTSAN